MLKQFVIIFALLGYTAPSFATELTVPVFIPKAENFTIQKSYIGTVQDMTAVSVVPFISGFIDEIKVQGGSKVKKGDILFILNQGEYIANQKSALAAKAKAEADLANAGIYWQRIENSKPEAVSKTDIDNAKANFLAAKASLKQAIANTELAEVNYNYTVIRSPISGTIGDIAVSKGDYVSPASVPLAYILQYSPIKIAFSIPNKEYMVGNNITEMQKQNISLLLDGGEPYTEKGKLLYADNKINKATSSVPLFALFDNNNQTLLPNAFVKVVFSKAVSNGILIPKNYIHLNENGYFCYVIADGIIKKVNLKVSAEKGNDFYVSEGLTAGDKVVIGNVPSNYIGKQAKAAVSDTNTHK